MNRIGVIIIKPILLEVSYIMPRKYTKIDCSKEDIIELTKLSSDGSDIRLATRAKIVLGCIEGKQIKDIAAELNERPNTVITWRRRFSENGIEGLLNRPRGYSGNRYGADLRERILNKLNTSPPDGRERWTGSTLSRDLNVPPDVIWRCLRKEGIKLTDIKIGVDDDSGSPTRIDYDIPLTISIREDSSSPYNSLSSSANPVRSVTILSGGSLALSSFE